MSTASRIAVVATAGLLIRIGWQRGLTGTAVASVCLPELLFGATRSDGYETPKILLAVACFFADSMSILTYSGERATEFLMNAAFSLCGLSVVDLIRA